MKTSKLDNTFDTDTMSPTARQQPARKETAQNKSERHFLADQAANAKTAMMQIVQEMTRTLTQGANVRIGTRHHPWIATGSAVAAGFVTATILSRIPSKAGERITAGAKVGAPPESPQSQPAPVNNEFLFSTLGKAVAGVAQSLLQSFIASAVAGTEVNRVKARSSPDASRQGASEPQTASEAHDCP